jgi:oligopeptidase B
MLARTRQDDATVPQREGDSWYYARYVPGGEYPIHARKRGTQDAPEQVLLDGNELARGHTYFQIEAYHVSPDDRRIAWVEDTVGRRQWTLRVKDLATGALLADRIANIEAEFVWADRGETLLYIEKDPVTLLGNRVRAHRLGADPASDPVVYEEKDPAFYLTLERSPSGRLLWIVLESTLATERRYAAADDPALAFRVLIPRERDHFYDAEDFGDEFVIRTNWQAKNFRIVRAGASDAADRSRWRDVVAHMPDTFIEEFFVFDDALAVGERSAGVRKIRIHRWSDGAESKVAAEEPSYAMSLGDNREPGAKALRYAYTSLTTPNSVYDYDFATGERVLRKRDPVLGAFDPASYRSELLWVTARDGARVPVSLVYRNGFARDGSAPLLLYGYGAYGISTDAAFDAKRLSLLDRGFVFAIAHVRGGQELGRDWYEAGKLLEKRNTFDDFIDVTRELVARGYAAKDRVFAQGGSAGGLLIGAVLNQCPECYRGAVTRVPFVDAVTTMLDESIPLTTNEFDEWGNPKLKAYYDYMLGYSPYDNVEAKAYPALLVTTGLWDSQVQYYEPTKWVAKLRTLNTGDRPLLLHVNMQGGHSGKSGRFERLREAAMSYAFLLDQAGVKVEARR